MNPELHSTLSQLGRPVILLEGTRQLAAADHVLLQRLAIWLYGEFPHAVFRSGNAEGSDAVFANAVAACDPARLELVLPNAGMGRGRRPAGARCVSLAELPEAELDNVVMLTGKAGRDAGRLGEHYLKSRNSGRSAAASKAAYLLRDTLKVAGSPALHLAPAALGLFQVNESRPGGGGTGHTIKVCELLGVPVAVQREWARWSESLG